MSGNAAIGGAPIGGIIYEIDRAVSGLGYLRQRKRKEDEKNRIIKARLRVAKKIEVSDRAELDKERERQDRVKSLIDAQSLKDGINDRRMAYLDGEAQRLNDRIGELLERIDALEKIKEYVATEPFDRIALIRVMDEEAIVLLCAL